MLCLFGLLTTTSEPLRLASGNSLPPDFCIARVCYRYSLDHSSRWPFYEIGRVEQRNSSIERAKVVVAQEPPPGLLVAAGLCSS